MKAAIFLDRDNTIIHNDGDLGDPEQVRLIQGAASAIASMCGLGYKIVVITNQGGVARGACKEGDVQAVNQRIAELVNRAANLARIDRFYYCPYHPKGKVKKYAKEHPDRKPQPGMILRAAEEMQLDLSQSWTIGDQMRDVEAGAAAGTRTILLQREAAALAPLDVTSILETLMEEEDSEHHRRIPTFKAPTLIEAVRIIAQQRKPEVGEHINRPLKGSRRMDRETMAKLQQPRPASEPDEPKPDVNSGTGPMREAVRPFRPWNAPSVETELAEALGEGKLMLEKAQSLTAGRVGQRETPVRKPPHKREEPYAEDAVPGADQAAGDMKDGAPADVKPVILENVVPPAKPLSPEQLSAAAEQEEVVTQPPPAPPPEEPPPFEHTAAPSARVSPIPAPTDPTLSQPVPEAPDSVPASSPVGDDESAKLLKHILTELRQQRGSGEEFSIVTIIAIILQLLAVVCLLGGLWMGQNDPALFTRWAVAATMAQLATIAMLLFGRSA